MTAEEALGGRVVEEMAGAGGVEAEVDTRGSYRGQLGASVGGVQQGIGTTTPNTELRDIRGFAMPESMRGGGGPMGVRIEVVEAGGMKDGKPPERWRSSGLNHEAAGHSAQQLVASLSNAILFGGVGKGVGGSDAIGIIELLQGPVEEFPSTTINSGTPITVDMLHRATEVNRSALDPGHESRRSIGFGFEEDRFPKPSGMVHNSEEQGMPIAVPDWGGLTEIHMDFIQQTARGIGMGWVRGSTQLALNTRGARRVSCGGWRSEWMGKPNHQLGRSHASQCGVPNVAKAVVSQHCRVREGAARARRLCFRG